MVKRRRRSSSSSAASSSSSSNTSSSSSSPTFDPTNPHILFALMLSALINRDYEKPTSEGYLIIQKALHHLLLSLLSKSPISILHSQHTPLISLLPLLLNSKCEEIACSGLEIVGAASLFSIEMNEQIALDDEIVKGVVKAVVSSRRSVSMAASNALLDLFTTSVGRCKVLELSAIDNLMFLNLQHLQFLYLRKNLMIKPSSE